ncbi:MAG: MBL fold metallo-hydrolase [Saprospiraceae bacterium]|nr:MBL fold metallo-hydrolase [Saprospiraceae bacterium]
MKQAIIFTLLLLGLQIQAQQDWDAVEIIPEKINENLYVLFGAGGNIGLFMGEDGTLIIDDQYAPLSEKIKAAINGLTDDPVKYVVNTHWHGDHTGGNEAFGNDGATIIAHSNVRKRLSTEQVMKAFNRTVPPSPEAAWPVITFEEDISLHVNGDDLMIFHVHNAHTDGDAFVYFKNSNVLHMGDCFFKGRFPFIDLGSGGSIDGAIRAVAVALMIVDEETVIIPGHGTLASKQDLLKYSQMLHTMRDRVKKAVAEGKTIDEIKTAGLDEGYEEWGTGFINVATFVDFIWTDLDRAGN